MVLYGAHRIGQVVDHFIHDHSVRWRVGNKGGSVGADELRPRIGLGCGKGNEGSKLSTPR
jgi:hypothetical protein